MKKLGVQIRVEVVAGISKITIDEMNIWVRQCVKQIRGMGGDTGAKKRTRKTMAGIAGMIDDTQELIGARTSGIDP